MSNQFDSDLSLAVDSNQLRSESPSRWVRFWAWVEWWLILRPRMVGQ